MKNKHFLFQTLMTVTLLLFSLTTSFAQTQTVPENLRGYWQFKAANASDWNGPVIGETFVENFYRIGYTEQVKQQPDGSYHFILRNNDGEKTEFRMSQITTDSATIWYEGWTTPVRCKKQSSPSYTDMLAPTALPSYIYQKWVQGLQGKIKYEFTKDGKVVYDGKTWHILSAGNFLNREYRLLVRNGESYKLLYLSSTIPNTLKVSAELHNNLLVPFAANSEVYAITGCWINAQTGDWTCGFFEKFAVYQNEFWEYESIRTDKGKSTVLLRNGNKHTVVQMDKKDRNKCLITFGKGKQQEYTLCESQYLPHYAYPDKTPFKDNGYSTDSVTIIGYLRNPPIDRPFEVSVPDMVIGDGKNEFHAAIDSLGRFSIRFPVLNSNDVFIDWMRTGIWTSLEPGETYFLFVDFATGQQLFMGKKARFQNERLAFDDLREFIPYDERDKFSNMEYLHKSQEIYQHKSNHLEKYIGQHPNISEKFRYYSRQAIRYDIGSDLMQRRFNVDRNNNEHLDPEFMDYIDSVFVQNPVQPYTLLRDYSSFIRDYTGYLTDIGSANRPLTFNPKEVKGIFERLENEGKIKLTAEDKQALDVMVTVDDKIDQLNKSGADSLVIAQYIEQIQPTFEKVNKLTSSQAWIDYINAITDPFGNSLKCLDSIPMDTNLREILVARLFYGVTQRGHIALSDTKMAQLTERVSNQSLLNNVKEQQTTYKELTQKALLYPESLKSNAPLEGITDGEELLKKIIEPYKGKVIYLDIWGTWCGPCKEMMQYAGNIKKLFTGKNITFLYLANHSSEESWRNLIKEYNLTGETSVHYNLPDGQQKAIEKFLGVRHFPTYFLIDKQGNVDKEEAPRPNDETELLNAAWKKLEQ